MRKNVSSEIQVNTCRNICMNTRAPHGTITRKP